MNKVILMGRLTRDVEIRYTAGENSMAIARFTLAVDRKYKRDGEATADFINCVSFGKTAEFADKYFRQGLKIAVTGRIQTGSYTNRDGQKVYTTEVVVEEQEFAESKSSSEARGNTGGNTNNSGGWSSNQYRNSGGNQQNSFADQDGFMRAPDNDDLPFH